MKHCLWPEFFRCAIPSTAGMMGISCYILADTFFVSQALGAQGLTALNLAIPVYSLIHGVGLMLGMGGATRCAILREQHETDKARRVQAHTLGLGAAFALVFFLLGLLCADPLTRLLGAEGEIFPMTRTYLQILLLSAPLFLLNDTVLPFVRNDGAPRLAMTGLLASSFGNILLDWVFMFPLGLGIFGAVLATSLAPAFSLALCTPFLLGKKCSLRPEFHKFRPKTIKTILSLGLPSLVAEVSSGVVMVVFNTILLDLQGELAVAAYGVVSNLALVVTALYTGLAQGVQPLVSRDYGGGRLPQCRQWLRLSLTAALTLSALICGGVLLGADVIAGIFNSQQDPRLQTMAAEGLRLYFTSCFFAGGNIVLATWLSSAERSRPANVLSLLRGLVLVIPAAFGMTALFGLRGLWLAVTVTEALTAMLGVYFLKRA